MTKEKAMKLQQQMQTLQQQIFNKTYDLYLQSVSNQSYSRTVENIITLQGQLQMLLLVMNDDKVEENKSMDKEENKK